MPPSKAISSILLNNMSTTSTSLLLFLFALCARADISHFLTPEYEYSGFYAPHNAPYPVHAVAFQPVAPPNAAPQPTLPSLYAAPSPSPAQEQEQPANVGYPFPTAPAVPTPTHAPVAPLPSTTTEFTLPEVVENRSVKQSRTHFIPLRGQYLPPPVEERPSYDAPRPPSYGVGYYYPRPTGVAFTTTTSSTTSTRPNPIVVIDPPVAFPAPTVSNDPSVLPQPQPTPPNQGYDYNAPPIFAQPTHTPSTPAPVYLPPTAAGDGSDAGTVVVAHTDAAANALRLRVKEMRCMQHGGGYFRAVLKVDSFISAAPAIDNDAHDKRCELKLSRSYVVADIAETDFQQCGVQACGKDLCLRVRFPAIRGMRTGADAILTLHCKTQQRVAVKTHALKMGVSNELQARSLGTYAHGGAQLPFRTHVEILRRAPGNGFTRHLEPHNAVQLGEELLLRAHVIAGDGWNYTKLSDVNVQRVSPSGELLNNAALITASGCVNPSMQSVCTLPPIYDPPLGHRLAFKAVMFQGMRSGDELVISMRITGCLEAHDCYVDAQECNGGGGSGLTQQWRRKRNISVGALKNGSTTSNATEVSEVTRIAFRVIMPAAEDVSPASSKNGNVTDMSADAPNERDEYEVANLKLVSALGFVLVLSCLGIFATLRLTK